MTMGRVRFSRLCTFLCAAPFLKRAPTRGAPRVVFRSRSDGYNPYKGRFKRKVETALPRHATPSITGVAQTHSGEYTLRPIATALSIASTLHSYPSPITGDRFCASHLPMDWSADLILFPLHTPLCNERFKVRNIRISHPPPIVATRYSIIRKHHTL